MNLRVRVVKCFKKVCLDISVEGELIIRKQLIGI